MALEASASPVPRRLATRQALTPVGQAEVKVTTATPSGGRASAWAEAKTSAGMTRSFRAAMANAGRTCLGFNEVPRF